MKNVPLKIMAISVRPHCYFVRIGSNHVNIKLCVNYEIKIDFFHLINMHHIFNVVDVFYRKI